MIDRMNFFAFLRRRLVSVGLGAAGLLGALMPAITPVMAAACDAPAAVCAWPDRIVGIKTPNMLASSPLLPGGYIVTNHHVAEDHPRLVTRATKGTIARALPQPHDAEVDLVLLRLEGAEPTLPDVTMPDVTMPEVGMPEVGIPAQASSGPQQLFIVAFDQGRKGPRVYRPGGWTRYPRDGASMRARIHTNARALPGNSGGAVVDDKGRLVGILASGDGKISEVIPAAHIGAVAGRTAEIHGDGFARTGRAIRECADALYDTATISRDPPPDLVNVIETRCMESGNKQLLDQAGQSFGRWWMFARSRAFLDRSLALDPDSPNSLMSMAVTLHLDRDLAAELPILRRYLAIDPANAQALRMAVQVAGGLGEREFGMQALELMRRHNPAAVPLAESFLEQAFAD